MTDYKEYKKLKNVFGDEKTTDTIIELVEKKTDELANKIKKEMKVEFKSDIEILKNDIKGVQELLRELMSDHDRLVGRVADYVYYNPNKIEKSEGGVQESSD